MAPADLFSSIPDDGGDITDPGTDSSTESEDISFTDPGDAPADEAAPEATEEEAPAAEPAAAEPAAAEPAQAEETLPEGVTKGTRSGKPGLFVEPSRWDTIYGNHQLVNQAAKAFGEPLTIESLQLRNSALQMQEKLFTHINSGDPQLQNDVVGYLFDEMQRAHQEGEVGADPSVPFAESFYRTMREKAPDAYAKVAGLAARDLLTDVYREAALKGDQQLMRSAQHITRMLANVPPGMTDIHQLRAEFQRQGIPFHSVTEMETLKQPPSGADELARLRAENASLKSGKAAPQTDATNYKDWWSTTSKSLDPAVVDSAIKPALSAVEASWKDFPDAYNDLVVDRLHNRVAKVIKDDTGFGDRIATLKVQAQRAASAQRRDAIGQQITQAYINRAKLAAEELKGDVLTFAAKSLAGQSAARHARQATAQNRTAPRGTTSTVHHSVVPMPPQAGGVFDPKKAVAEGMRLLGV